MITSRMSSKAQTTVPQAVRLALGLREGDELSYEIQEGRVLLSKARAVVQDDPFVTFDEWNSEADRRAYGDL